jgi:hypothetical protein
MPSARLVFRSARILAPMLLAAALALAVSGCDAYGSGRHSPRTVEFSGYSWRVKSSQEPIGPGPNYFSDSAKNVWVDSRGRLHLKLTHSNGRWYSAEVINTQSLGRGRYSFELGSPVSHFDPNVVLALFTWSDDPSYSNREIDIEFSRWAKRANPVNGQYVVQPYYHHRNRQRVRQPAAAPSTQSFNWRPNAVTFASSSALPSAWTYSGTDVPRPGSEHVHINLWLYRGARPKNGRAAEVIVDGFSFSGTA